MLNVLAITSMDTRDMTSQRGAKSIGDDALPRHAADFGADNLDGDHERRRQENRPQQAMTKLRSGWE